jgi:hypothetical protein
VTAPELVARLEAAGAAVLVKGGKPRLVLPPGEALSTDERIDLHLHRDAVLAHFARDGREVAVTCRECGCGVFSATAGDVFRCCGNVACPWWLPGLGPEWLARARSYRQWKREQEAEERKRLQEPIPE